MWSIYCHTIFQIFIIWIERIEITKQNGCDVSFSTLRMVSACPTTVEELQNAKTQKRCDSLALIQKCVLHTNFTYHCVINFSFNETYEVCAPAIFSQGHCLEFNKHGKVIQELPDTDCVKLGCPKRFRSADVLKYVQCSNLVKQKISKTDKFVIKDSIKNTSTTDFRKSKTTRGMYEYVTYILIGVLIMIPISYFLIRYIRKKRGNTSNEPDHNDPEQIPLDAGNLTSEVSNVQEMNIQELALANLSTDYESHKRKKKTTEERRIRNSSIESTISNVSVKTGYDAGSFSFYLKKYNLQECKESLFNNGIDCVRTFLDLDRGKMQAFGLKYGQIQKCLLAIQDISKERT
ncbi:uncharacterized protein LOC125675901 isoform X2 [Ostrea edulis]|uniref:uncharacterized protein LOC125675901 isoform X2 n=1 Tax=Ostrea edulis TaxID=37623 RepID=UPI0024AFBA2D|nr:uncharacterized protein LOC125675901 isoform X2 [Ostrea edulis]